MTKVSDSKDYKLIAEKMFDLYIVKDYPFIKQSTDGKYSWMYNIGKLSDENYKILVNHLHRKQTIGIMCHTHTKFICFDVDFKADKLLSRWYSQKLVNLLQAFNFAEKYINVSLSGSKGYHVEVFFDEVVSFKQIEYLYDLVLEELYYSTDYNSLKVTNDNNMTLEQLKQKIELRPKSNIGVKLPLSIHQVTKNVCYYCDNISIDPIRDINHIFSIQKCPREYIEYAIEKGNEFRHDRESINRFNTEVKEKVKPAKSQRLYTSEEYTVEYIEDLIDNGLKIQGSRHNSLMKIARYYYHLGLASEDNEKELYNWMQWQNEKYYNSSEIEWRNDIKSILEYVYENARGITGIVRDVTINKIEMIEILKHSARKKKLLFYALIIHSKRYSINNGEFYMTYEQIYESTGLADDTITKYIKELLDEGEIEITRQGEKRNHSNKNLPNKYIIKNINIRSNNNQDKNVTIDKHIKNLEKSFNNNVIYLFDKKELKEVLPYRQYKEFITLYA
jgi:hypothetical protein